MPSPCHQSYSTHAGGEVQELLPRSPLGPDRVRPRCHGGMHALRRCGARVLPSLVNFSTTGINLVFLYLAHELIFSPCHITCVHSCFPWQDMVVVLAKRRDETICQGQETRKAGAAETAPKAVHPSAWSQLTRLDRT